MTNWKIAALYPPPKDEVLLVKDMQGKEYIAKWNGKLFMQHGKGILPQPIYWFKRQNDDSAISGNTTTENT